MPIDNSIKKYHYQIMCEKCLQQVTYNFTPLKVQQYEWYMLFREFQEKFLSFALGVFITCGAIRIFYEVMK